MFFDPMHTMRQLLRAIPQRGRASRSVSRPSAEPITGFGCCPVCHDFVRVDSWGPTGGAICPGCGRLIHSLDSLGSTRSLGATDEG